MRPTGPIPAQVMIVGEAPGMEEERRGEPFCGPSGHLLTNLLHSVGLARSSCFVTNVCRVRPPGNDISLWTSENKKSPDPTWVRLDGLWVHPHIAAGRAKLDEEIALVQPRIVLALGNTALWALTGRTGVGTLRGSRIETDRFTVIPTLHPAAVLRQMDQAPVFQMDLRRVKNLLEGKQVPRETFVKVAPAYVEVLTCLSALLHRADMGAIELAGDIETRGKFITCWGVAWSETEALTIPFITTISEFPFYWTVDEEAEILFRILALHRHPNITWLGQNYLYDCQYYHRHWLGVPRKVVDIMIRHHACYSTMRKSLAFQASMYCSDYVYWKDDHKAAGLTEKAE